MVTMMTTEPDSEAVASDTPVVLDPFSGSGGKHKAIEQLRVSYPRLRRLEQKINQCRLWSRDASDPHCMLVMGDSGVGKSSIVKTFLERHPPRQEPEGRIVPALYVTTPMPATIKFVATRILASLGDPSATRGTVEEKTQRILNYFKRCKVEVIFLDEFQHMIDPDKRKVMQSVSDWLKNLISDSELPVILVGLPHCVSILTANPQLNRRFSAQETLEPFRWDTQKDRKDYQDFLNEIDENLPFEKSGLGEPEMAQRMFAATRGSVGTTMKIIRYASHKAVSGKEDRLTPSRLSKAFKVRVLNRQRAPDPFLGPLLPIDLNADFIIGSPPYGEEVSEETDSRKTKERKPSAKDVLEGRV